MDFRRWNYFCNSKPLQLFVIAYYQTTFMYISQVIIDANIEKFPIVFKSLFMVAFAFIIYFSREGKSNDAKKTEP